MADRRAVVAGRFYPGNPETLRREVDAFLGPERGELEPLMIMLPHAGYMYCGAIIGKTLSGARLPQTLILLGPNHTGRGRPLSVWPDGAWMTPLGPVDIDDALAARCIGARCGFEADTQAHAADHCLEVLLPFLQRHTPGARIVPVSVALNNLEALRLAGGAIALLMSGEREAGRRTALVVSSDMNHFDTQENTVRKDALALAPLLELLPEKFFTTVRGEGISMCGVLPATLALFACKALGAKEARLAARGTSAAASGDASRVVGYAGAWVW